MLKYPPPRWRVIKLDSLEKRTSDNMTEFAGYVGLQSCCRLEIGCLNFGNMLRDEDLPNLFANLKHLTSLKLLWCHLIRAEGFIMSIGLPGALRLSELTLFNCQVNVDAIVTCCPNLTSITLINCSVANFVSLCRLRGLRRVLVLNMRPCDSNFSSIALNQSSLVQKLITDRPGLSHLWAGVPGGQNVLQNIAPGTLRVLVAEAPHPDAPLPATVDYFCSSDLLGRLDVNKRVLRSWEEFDEKSADLVVRLTKNKKPAQK